ncbi:MAG: hypothetical protein ABR505_02930 [Actinomycetota bacterium]
MGRDAGSWAKSGTDLRLKEIPSDAINLNVEGRNVTSPIQGFGKMWQKTYRVVLGPNVEPAQVVRVWKQHFGDFWPEGNRFYGPLTGIAAGEVALLNLTMPGKVKLSTGMLVLYADEESFTLMTPQGHMFAGWITFSAESSGNGTVAQVQILMRASDPLYELGLAFGGHRKEDKFWNQTLTSLASFFGVQGEVAAGAVCVDRKRQWKRWKNIYKNAAIRSGMYAAGTPFRRKPKTKASS